MKISDKKYAIRYWQKSGSSSHDCKIGELTLNRKNGMIKNIRFSLIILTNRMKIIR